MRRVIVVLTISLLLSLGVLAIAEVTVRVAGIEPQDWPAADVRLRFRGVEVDPILGGLPKPGWSGKWFTGFAVAFDDRGFRRTEMSPPTNAPARVAFLGDSCTFGWGLNTPDTFVSRLDAHQAAAGNERLDLMNAGYPGHTAVIGVEMLRERVLPYEPNLVVLGFSANNAFRFSVTSDPERLRFAGLRRLLLRSRLFHVAAAWLANRAPPPGNPRDRKAIAEVPFSAVRRLADPEAFATAVRAMVSEARAHGAEALLLIFPRASAVSTDFPYEDAALEARRHPLPPPQDGGPPTAQELPLLEGSCLNHRALAEPGKVLRGQLLAWQPVYPANPDVLKILHEGAAAYVKDDYTAARGAFERATQLDPSSPLAAYDLGVARLAGGDAGGLSDLDKADRLACNVFLEYQVILWRVALELSVPVVDLTLYFQAHDGESLFMDPAHPNAAGQEVIAAALAPAVKRYAGTR